MSKYKINQGDIIRIGRITTRIKNICFNGSSSNNKQTIENEKNLIEVQEPKNKSISSSATSNSNANISNSKKSLKKQISKVKNKICRICYME